MGSSARLAVWVLIVLAFVAFAGAAIPVQVGRRPNFWEHPSTHLCE